MVVFFFSSANAIKAVSLDPLINDHPLFRAAYYNSNGQLKKKGDLVKRPEFAKVLSDIARLGARAFYTGAIADEIVSAVSSTGGILTKEDLGSYEADVEIPLNVSIMDTLLHTLQVPSGGPDLAFPLNVMDVFLRGKDLEERRGNATYQFLVEVGSCGESPTDSTILLIFKIVHRITKEIFYDCVSECSVVPAVLQVYVC